MSQTVTTELDITGLGKLNEWNDITTMVDNIRKDFTHSNNKQQRKRRAKGVTIGTEFCVNIRHRIMVPDRTMTPLKRDAARGHADEPAKTIYPPD